MTTPSVEQCVFSDDPEINQLCERRADILEFMSYNQVTPQELLEELDDLNKRLEVFGF